MLKNSCKYFLASLTIAACAVSTAMAQTLFSDDFGGSLSTWTGQNGDATSGNIIDDPLRAGNKVLTFTALGSGGDIFSQQQFALTPGQSYRVDFEYLGLAKPGSVANDFGGFAGLSAALPRTHMWYYATSTAVGAADVLLDNGQWQSHTYEFTSPVNSSVGNDVHLMFEDFSGSNGIAGDVYFDNIRFSAVPASSGSFVL